MGSLTGTEQVVYGDRTHARAHDVSRRRRGAGTTSCHAAVVFYGASQRFLPPGDSSHRRLLPGCHVMLVASAHWDTHRRASVSADTWGSNVLAHCRRPVAESRSAACTHSASSSSKTAMSVAGVVSSNKAWASHSCAVASRRRWCNSTHAVRCLRIAVVSASRGWVFPRDGVEVV